MSERTLRSTHPHPCPPYLPDLFASRPQSQAATFASRIPNRMEHVCRAATEATDVFVIAATAHFQQCEGTVRIGETRLPEPYALAYEELGFLMARMYFRLQEDEQLHRLDIPALKAAESLLEDGFCAFHAVERLRSLWNGRAEDYQVSDHHTIVLVEGAHTLVDESFIQVNSPWRAFNANNPAHTSYRLTDLIDVMQETSRKAVARMRKPIADQLRQTDSRFVSSPLETFELLERLTAERHQI